MPGCRWLSMMEQFSWDEEAAHTCSGVVRVSMSFCTARVPWVFSATVTSCLFSAIFCKTCTGKTAELAHDWAQQCCTLNCIPG